MDKGHPGTAREGFLGTKGKKGEGKEIRIEIPIASA